MRTQEEIREDLKYVEKTIRIASGYVCRPAFMLTLYVKRSLLFKELLKSQLKAFIR